MKNALEKEVKMMNVAVEVVWIHVEIAHQNVKEAQDAVQEMETIFFHFPTNQHTTSHLAGNNKQIRMNAMTST